VPIEEDEVLKTAGPSAADQAAAARAAKTEGAKGKPAARPAGEMRQAG
jgi:hypothetical protein